MNRTQKGEPERVRSGCALLRYIPNWDILVWVLLRLPAMKVNYRIASLGVLIALGQVPTDGLAQSAKAQPKPYYLDSTYDRFKGEHRVILSSRSAIASNGMAL